MTDDLIILQARVGSTRLPNKVILPFYHDQSILDILIDKLKPLNQQIVVATTTSLEDDSIETISCNHKVDVFRGDENNVLKRFIDCAKLYKAKRIIRICADNPFLDIDSCLKLLESNDSDYSSFCLSTGTPSIKTHYGFWAEIVTLNALIKVNESTSDNLYREHVTNFIYTNPEDYKIKWIPIPLEVEKMNIRLTIDTIQDFKLAKYIYGELSEQNIQITPLNIISYLKNKPDYINIMNIQIEQNTK